jgi:hypothetical protein
VRVPKKLPVVIIEDEAYFFDFRLKQVRRATNPNDFLDLSNGDCLAIEYQLRHGVYEFVKDDIGT